MLFRIRLWQTYGIFNRESAISSIVLLLDSGADVRVKTTVKDIANRVVESKRIGLV